MAAPRPARARSRIRRHLQRAHAAPAAARSTPARSFATPVARRSRTSVLCILSKDFTHGQKITHQTRAPRAIGLHRRADRLRGNLAGATADARGADAPRRGLPGAEKAPDRGGILWRRPGG